MRGIVLLLFAFAFPATIPAAEVRTIDLTPIARWIESQSKIQTIEADFTQTRSLKTLRSPLTAEGRFWFRAPSRFRWQLGDRSIALGTPAGITLIDPRRKTAQHSSSAQLSADARMNGFEMLRFPLAGSFEEFRERFQVRDLHMDGDVCRVTMLPRNAEAAQMLDGIEFSFETTTGYLQSFRITTRDGSSLTNEFRNVKVNEPVPDEVFEFDLSGYDVEEAGS